MPRDGFHSEAALSRPFDQSRHRWIVQTHGERLWVPALLIFTDIVVLEFCLYLGFMTRSLLAPWFPVELASPAYAALAAGLPVVTMCFNFMGLYPGYGVSDVERLKQQQTGAAIIFSSLLVWDHLAQGGAWSRGVLLATWFFAAILLPPAFALVRSQVVRAERWGMPVVVIGSGEAAEHLIAQMRKDPRLGFRPAAVLSGDPFLTRSTVAGVPVLGTIADAPEMARSIRVCAIAMPELGGQQQADLSSQLPFPHVVLLPDLGTLPTAWVSPRDLGGALGLEIKKNLLLGHNRLIKRIAETGVCIPLFLVCLPLLAVLAAAIYAISPGRPFYTQRREGLDGRPFNMFKLRTMHPDAEERLERHLRENPEKRAEWERCFKLRNDPRVLPWIGTFLRKSSLDELPQLLNVLRGEMSLVGPRPFPYYHLDCYDDRFREFRRSVEPGVTGLWQVEVRSEGDIEDQRMYDSYYIRNWSLWLDLYILFKTVAVVLSRRGAR